MTYRWQNQARILTYADPFKLMKNEEIAELVKTSPHLCASDTLLQGLTKYYGRDKFHTICAIDTFIETLFGKKFSNAQLKFNMYIDVTASIEEKLPQTSDQERMFKRAFEHNKQELVDACELLALSRFKVADEGDYDDIQSIFFSSIFNAEMRDKYVKLFDDITNTISRVDVANALKNVLLADVSRFLNSDKVLSETQAKEGILQKKNSSDSPKVIASCQRYLDILGDYPSDFQTIVIHGLMRFTPRVMRLIECLDNLGFQIVFLHNYASNIPEIYGVWDDAYSWTGIAKDSVSVINLDSRAVAGKNIAKICKSEIPEGNTGALFIKYPYLTDFANGEVRPVFQAAQIEAKAEEEKRGSSYSFDPLGYMKKQYYSVDSETANEVLKNYFPEQFTNKPFLSYPVGQFIVELYSMWDFDKREMKIDFDSLINSSVAGIGHKCIDMIGLLERVRLYFSDIQYYPQFVERSIVLASKISDIENNKAVEEEKAECAHLAFYNVSSSELLHVQKYVENLRILCERLFEKAASQVNFRKHFQEALEMIGEENIDSTILSKKERDLIEEIKGYIGIDSDDDIEGSPRQLHEALNLYLHIKKQKSSADWIVRGFDQLDGAPLLSKHGDRYELAMVSMEAMTRKGYEFLPWPLTEKVLSEEALTNVYFDQLKNSVDNRSKYLLYYLFFASFFSDAQITYSYIVENGEETNRPFFILELLNGMKDFSLFNPEESGTARRKIYSAASKPTYELIIERPERDWFAICTYKFFLSGILKGQVEYKDDFLAKYYIKRNMYIAVAKHINKANAPLSEWLSAIEDIKDDVWQRYPFLDDAAKNDILDYVKGEHATYLHYGVPQQQFVDRVRNFLVNQMTENGTNYMDFNLNNTRRDIHSYIQDGSRLYPQRWPYEKICMYCNYKELCLHYYSAKNEENE